MSPTKCASHHFGPWAIDAQWFTEAVAAVQSGILRAEAPAQDSPDPAPQAENGVAVIRIDGAMMKIRSKFGGTSTVDVRNQVRLAASDPSVSSIMLVIDSPGGTVAGTDALAADVAWANSQKPVHAHIEDMGASAAYWIASQAGRITASPTSLVGSLGARMSVIDSSEYFATKGIKVHAIASGEFKAAGEEGVVITGKQLEYFQGIVNDAADHFKAAVMKGRGWTQERANQLFDGRVHDAAVAEQIGLIDQVSTLDAAMAALQQETTRMNMESFKAFAAEHPEAVATFIEQGQKQGAKLGQDATIAMIEAFPGRTAFAIEQIKAGRTIDEAKAIAATVERETAEANATIAAQQAEIDRLKAEAGTQPAVGTRIAAQSEASGSKVAAFVEGSDPKAHAAAEWEADKTLAEQFTSKDVYIAYRAAELSGRARVSKSERPTA